jgi:hypothetical protein
MTVDEARVILGDDVKPDGSLSCIGRYLYWKPGDETATLDADFSADELEAIAVLMRATPSR